MNDWQPFGHNDPLLSDEERAHVLVSAVEYRPGQWEATCSCKASTAPLLSEAACENWVLIHREIEASLAITVPGYER